jgi:lysozyme family protein
MASLEPALKKLLLVEGGYADVAGDRGGETYCGISRKHHPGWSGWLLIDQWKDADRPGKSRADTVLLTAAVASFYRAEFWGPLLLDEMNHQAIAEEVFDSAVNAGPARAVKWLQQALNMVGRPTQKALEVDGRCGPVTIAAVNRCTDQPTLLKVLNGLQFMHYHWLVEADPSQKKFFRGWMRRVWEH